MNVDDLHAPIIPDQEMQFADRPATTTSFRRAGPKSRADQVYGGQEGDHAKDGQKEKRKGAYSAHKARAICCFNSIESRSRSIIGSELCSSDSRVT